MSKIARTLLPKEWIFIAILFFTICLTANSAAQNFTVNSTADNVDINPGDGIAADLLGNTTLRAAIMEANALAGAQTITLPAGIYLFALVGIVENAAATGDLDITGDLTINGAGPTSTIIDGGDIDRVLEVRPGATVQIDAVTVRNGYPGNGYPGIGIGRGGGIINRGVMTLANSIVTNNTGTFLGGGIWNSGTMTITNSTVSGNAQVATPSGESGGGGGIFNQGTMTLIGTTVSGNTTLGYDGRGGGINNLDQSLTLINSTIGGNIGYNGGAIFNRYGLIQITNSTISGNTAIAQGGGIWNFGGSDFGGSANLKNTIVANNSPNDLLGVITTLGHNIVSDNSGGLSGPGDLNNTNLMLGPLADNGGPTQTHALLPGSPAIDAVPLAFCTVSTDQRGIVRPQGASCDIGAYESLTTIEDLTDEVRDLVTAGVLNKGQGNALITKLNGAINKLNKGNTNAAINKLQAFINQVSAFINAGILSSAEGQPLIDAAQAIIDAIQSGLYKQAGEPASLEQVPYEYKVFQNYPNPFNPTTTIQYQIPNAGFVTLKVYDLLGREVAKLVQEYLKAGHYNVTFNAKGLPSGVYLYRLQTGDPSTGSGQSFVDTKKLILIK